MHIAHAMTRRTKSGIGEQPSGNEKMDDTQNETALAKNKGSVK